jgi:hypothetical protein
VWTPESAGIQSEALWRYVEEQICSLPGVDDARSAFTVLLTGSRSVGIHSPTSDVDIDVVCPQAVYESVQEASYEAGIVASPRSFFCTLKGDDWGRYYGPDMGRPHFSLTGLDRVAQQFAAYDDVAIWIWTNARVLADPDGQFGDIVAAWPGYPLDVLVRKIKYHWLLAGYWEVDVFPHHHRGERDLLAASAGLVNAINELLRCFFLLDARPFPYTEKLLHLAPRTSLGPRFVPLLQRIVDLVTGRGHSDTTVWERLDRACELLFCYDLTEECRALEDACAEAMKAAGVDPEWVDADYSNIDELLRGDLGPMP